MSVPRGNLTFPRPPPVLLPVALVQFAHQAQPALYALYAPPPPNYRPQLDPSPTPVAYADYGAPALGRREPYGQRDGQRGPADPHDPPRHRPPPRRYDANEDRDRLREAHRRQIQKSVCMDVPTFEGSRDPKDYEDWENELESYFRWYDMDDDLCVAYVETRLSKEAKIFWLNEVTAATLRSDPPITWDVMSRTLRDKYVPKHHVTHLLLCCIDLKQGRHKVREYIKEFEECRMRCDFVKSPEIQIALFVHGLKLELGAKVLELSPSAVDQAYWLIENNEYILDNSSISTLPATKAIAPPVPVAWMAPSPGWAKSATSAPKGPTMMLPPTSPTTTPLPTSSTTPTHPTTSTSIQCFKCKGFGHKRLSVRPSST